MYAYGRIISRKFVVKMPQFCYTVFSLSPLCCSVFAIVHIILHYFYKWNWWWTRKCFMLFSVINMYIYNAHQRRHRGRESEREWKRAQIKWIKLNFWRHFNNMKKMKEKKKRLKNDCLIRTTLWKRTIYQKEERKKKRSFYKLRWISSSGYSLFTHDVYMWMICPQKEWKRRRKKWIEKDPLNSTITKKKKMKM